VSVRMTATDTRAHLESLCIMHLPRLRLSVALIACLNYLLVALNIFVQRSLLHSRYLGAVLFVVWYYAGCCW
jgi:hypothetical protein